MSATNLLLTNGPRIQVASDRDGRYPKGKTGTIAELGIGKRAGRVLVRWDRGNCIESWVELRNVAGVTS